MRDIWFLYLILAAFPGLILFAMIYKYVEVVQASRWSSASGRVVVSTTETRRVDASTANKVDTELRNFAKVVYEYMVAGRVYRCDRVTIMEDLGNFDIAATLARYPVGKAVTVYYNPNRRKQAVLERDPPPGIWTGASIVVGVLSAIIVGGVFGVSGLAEWLRGVIGTPAKAPMVTGFLFFAFFTGLFAWAFHKQGVRVRSWPQAAGQVVSSGVKKVLTRSAGRHGTGPWRTHYQPEIVYAFEVNGVRYTGTRGSMGGQSSSTLESLARRTAARFPEGLAVGVRYNPDNPAESAIETRIAWIGLLWIFPFVFLALAWVFAR